uniref:Uncharacterized protein n=1 Tax=Parastrongyloides trichosuri TaxID=131310 RepID=A0A0N4ZI00_PARTI
MIKRFILLIILLNIINVDGKKCGGSDFVASFKAKFTCKGDFYKNAIVDIGSCRPGTNQCKTIVPNIDIQNEVTTGSAKVTDSDDDLNFIVSQFCSVCPGSFKLSFPSSGVNCDSSTSNTHDFGTVELSDPAICAITNKAMVIGK